MEPSRWDHVVAGSQPFPMYFTSWFMDFACEVSGGSRSNRTVSDGADQSAVIALVGRHDADLGLVINSLPWFGGYGGVAVAPEAPAGVRLELLAEVRSVFEHPSVGFATINLAPNEMAHIDTYTRQLRPRLVVPRRTQVTMLPAGQAEREESLMSLFHPKARNAVRKGLGGGFRMETVDTDEAWEGLARLHATNMARVGGRPKSLDSIRLLRARVPAEHRRLTVARSGDRAVAALLTIRVGSTVEYLIPAVDEPQKSSQVLSALIWHEMLQACTTGATRWNWGGTGWQQESLLRFKSRRGGKLVPYATLVTCTDDAIGVLRGMSGRLPGGLMDYYLYPFAELDQEAQP